MARHSCTEGVRKMYCCHRVHTSRDNIFMKFRSRDLRERLLRFRPIVSLHEHCMHASSCSPPHSSATSSGCACVAIHAHDCNAQTLAQSEAIACSSWPVRKCGTPSFRLTDALGQSLCAFVRRFAKPEAHTFDALQRKPIGSCGLWYRMMYWPYPV